MGRSDPDGILDLSRLSLSPGLRIPDGFEFLDDWLVLRLARVVNLPTPLLLLLRLQQLALAMEELGSGLLLLPNLLHGVLSFEFRIQASRDGLLERFDHDCRVVLLCCHEPPISVVRVVLDRRALLLQQLM